MKHRLLAGLLVLLVLFIGTPTIAAASYEFTVTTDKESYSPGSEVLISGSLKKDGTPLFGAALSIVVADSSNNYIWVDQAITDSSGLSTSTFKLNPDAKVGTYQVMIGTDADGATLNAQTTFVVQGGSGDTTPPTSQLSAPQPNAVLTSLPILVSGSAQDDVAVLKVEVSIDNGATWQLAAGANNWSFVWRQPANGAYTLRSRATDTAGNVETPAAGIQVTVNVSQPPAPDTTPPPIVILFPTSGAILSRQLLTVVGQTELGAQVSVSGKTAEVDESGYFTANLMLNEGENTLLCKATDQSGNVAEVSLQVVYKPAEASAFPDILGHWAQKDIESLLALKIISGYPDGLFRPEGNITRVEFTKMVVTALKLELYNPTTSTFKDAPPEFWGFPYIETAAKDGIVNGVGEGLFAPDRGITRSDISVIVARALKLTGGSPLTFADTNLIPDYALDFVSAAVQAGIVKGYPDNTFRPLNNATRAEAAVMMLRMLSLASSS